jgi:Ras-related protein Rab-28
LQLVRKTFVDKVTGNKLKPPKLYLVGNKVDLIHLRKIDETQHKKFEQQYQMDGGFMMSAQSGENVLKVFYQCAADSAGVKLSQYELAFTEKCLTASVVEQNEGRTAIADRIEQEDAAMAAAAARRAEKSCNCSIS